MRAENGKIKPNKLLDFIISITNRYQVTGNQWPKQKGVTKRTPLIKAKIKPSKRI
jgi:hypothetical protein